jgi:hypothetical protein
MSRRKYGNDKFFQKISHTATSGIVGDEEYQVKGENNLRAVSTFASSGTLTVQGRIEGSDTWDDLGTLASGGDSDTFDISTYDFVRFNFTVAAGSGGEIAASGFFNGSSAGGGGASNSFAIIQPDVGTSPTADSATDTLTLTSSDSSITITGNSTTDTVDFVVATTPPSNLGDLSDVTIASPTNGEVLTYNSSTGEWENQSAGGGGGPGPGPGGSGDVTGPSSSTDNAIVRFDGTTGKVIQDYTSSPPTITDAGVASFADASHAQSERVGALSTVGGVRATAYGYNAGADSSDSTSIGWNSGGTAVRHVCLGRSATVSSTGTASIAIGYITSATGSAAAAIGSNASASQIGAFAMGNSCTATNAYAISVGNSSAVSGDSSVAIGRNITVSHNRSFVVGRDGTSTANNQFIAHNHSEFWLGYNPAGGTNAAIGTTTINFKDIAAGNTDQNAPATVTFKAGTGTGTGTGTHFVFQTAPAGTTGSTQNSYVTQLEITDDGNIIMPNLPTSSAGLPTGALWNNSGAINIA